MNAFQFSIDLGLKTRYVDAAEVIFVSSAYILGEPRLKQFGKSFI